MPELPEVETIRQDLRKKVLNKKIVHVEVLKNKAVANQRQRFVAALTGNTITDISRRGKLMIFWFSYPAVILSEAKNPSSIQRVTAKRDPSVASLSQDDSGVKVAVLVHLKMTGQLIYERQVKNRVEVVAGGHKLTESDFDLPNKHTQVIITFADGGRLFFNDLRRFGYMKLASQKEVEAALSRFGIEPMTTDFTWKNFEAALGQRKVSIKTALMDQPKIAGIGNIYADEICFCAWVRPTRAVSSLTTVEKKKIFACVPKIIADAIKHRGTTFKDYLDTEGKKGNYTDFLKVYDREGGVCLRCGGTVNKIKVNGRGTHFCPECQK